MNKKEKILHRSRIIEGHAKKVTKMIESGDYCIDILNQSLAVQCALKKLDEAILEDHLTCCVVKQIKDGKAEAATKEVLAAFRKRS